MRIFLTLKAWQLFLLLIVPMFAPMFIVPAMKSMLPFSIISLAWIFVLVGWLVSVGIASNKRLPKELAKSTVLYKFGFGFAVCYASFMFLVLMPQSIQAQPNSFPGWAVPAHLFSMFGMFYGLWFTAKQFTTLQRLEKVSFLEYSGPFFLFWFCFIGVWFLQPKINEVLGKENIA